MKWYGLFKQTSYIALKYFRASRPHILLGPFLEYLVPLTLPIQRISESCTKIKTNLNFYGQISLWCLKDLMKAFKAIMKHFKHHKEVWKQKKLVNFLSSSGIGTRRDNYFHQLFRPQILIKYFLCERSTIQPFLLCWGYERIGYTFSD